MSERQCLECTACCEGWITALVNDVGIKPYKPCVNRTDKGCAIYNMRPENPCVSFKCGWLISQSPLPEEMKPNECGAIVLIGRLWNYQKVTYAMPTGNTIPKSTLEWLMGYSRENSTPLIFFENVLENGKFIFTKRMGYGPKSFVLSINNEVNPKDVFMF